MSDLLNSILKISIDDQDLLSSIDREKPVFENKVDESNILSYLCIEYALLNPNSTICVCSLAYRDITGLYKRIIDIINDSRVIKSEVDFNTSYIAIIIGDSKIYFSSCKDVSMMRDKRVNYCSIPIEVMYDMLGTVDSDDVILSSVECDDDEHITKNDSYYNYVKDTIWKLESAVIYDPSLRDKLEFLKGELSRLEDKYI